ncbi:CLUMA_CG003811, isoform A [Clunio marinus]|uniref:CLUMA_CG003811, isoform A n=1 Tax=Clunio marinus TaxID=568069 RepID=A0A1J1HPX8_9DIPT|nr:CLUMA_CG003811, isoform A [Clunio marinus]
MKSHSNDETCGAKQDGIYIPVILIALVYSRALPSPMMMMMMMMMMTMMSFEETCLINQRTLLYSIEISCNLIGKINFTTKL